ncbi:glycosyl transferase family 39 [Xenophilus aerolatus]|nr:glycosyl transferase family 39 [Xenophilus aerolatus]
MNRAPARPDGARGDAAFLLVAALWLALSIGWRPLTSPDEGRYASVAYAMLQSGDWLVPRLNGLPFFHKPPLFYWIGAAAMAVAGPHPWAARLPSLVGAWLAAGALFWFLRRHASHAQARLATAVLCSAPFFYVGAQFANLDMLVAGCISACVLAAVDAALARECGRPWRGALALAFAAAALGLLSKGLIGVVLPAGVVLLWALASRRPRVLRLAAWWPGWLLLLAIAGPWFVAMQRTFPAFFDYFVITQHFRRFAAGGFNNEHPFWFYLPVMLGLCLPWSAWLLAAWRRPEDGPGRARRRLDDVDLLMLAWAVVVVLFFSLPRSKLIGYVLPALPPLATGIARFAGRAATAGAGRRLLGATAGAAALACLGSVVLAARLGTPPDATLHLPAGQAVAPGDRVVMLGQYFYELPFYWRLPAPAVVAADWRPEVAQASDNWRKELADAARFDADAATRLLQPIEVQPAAVCAAGRSWVIGPPDAPVFAPWVLGMTPVTSNAHIAVWRHDGRAGDGADCLSHSGPRGTVPRAGAAA